MLTREVAALSVDAADLMGSSGMINTLRGGTVSGSSADVLSIVAFKNERANQLHSHETTVRSDSISSASRLAQTYMRVYICMLTTLYDDNIATAPRTELVRF